MAYFRGIRHSDYIRLKKYEFMSKNRKNHLLLRYFFILLISLSTLTCKQTQKSPYPEFEDRLIISFEALVELDDKFQLYFRNEVENFSEDKSISTSIPASPEFQEVRFVLKELDFPYAIRLDFGENKNQKTILFRNLTFSYNNEKHVLTKKEIKKYFVPNKYIKTDFEELSITPIPLEGGYDPFLSSYNISYFVNKLILY